MAIRIYLDEILRERHMTSKELCRLVGITEANLSILRSGKAFGGLRFDRLCGHEDPCQTGVLPGQLLQSQPAIYLDEILRERHMTSKEL